MASSRKPRSSPDAADAPLLRVLVAAVGALAAPAPAPAPLERTPRGAGRAAARRGPLLIAYSGGRDSTVLLDACVRLRAARAPGFAALLAVHVDHGMQPAAADFVAHCAAECARLQVPLEVRRVTVERSGQGPEAAARAARYGALFDAAAAHGARAVLTAHQRDDRLETFLLQWQRGAGPEGLAAFPPLRRGAEGAALLRPFIDLTRADIDAWIARHGLPCLADPTNSSPAFARNALRAQVMPALAALRPGYARAAARSVDLVAEAAEVLREVGAADLAACRSGASPAALQIDRLAALTPARRALVLRRWLSDRGLAAPPRARLRQVLHQALHARGDARLLVRFGEHELRRQRGLLMLVEPASRPGAPVSVHWQGEAAIAVPRWRGVLHFVALDDGAGERPGFAPAWLMARPLELRARAGGERLKPHPLRPSRTLKRAFQDAGIAEFERAALPLLWRDDELVYVAGLGPDVRYAENDGPRVALHWQPDAPLFGAPPAP